MLKPMSLRRCSGRATRVWYVKPSLILKRDLEWAKEVMPGCADRMRDLDEELLAREYTEIVFGENRRITDFCQIRGGRKK